MTLWAVVLEPVNEGAAAGEKVSHHKSWFSALKRARHLARKFRKKGYSVSTGFWGNYKICAKGWHCYNITIRKKRA